MDDCSCLYGEGDLPEFSTRSWVKARKIHRCCECKRSIGVGEKYERYSGKWDGRIDVYTTCAECQNIRESLYCEGWCLMQLWEDIQEQIFAETGLTIACIDKLTTAEAKQKLQDEWIAYLNER